MKCILILMICLSSLISQAGVLSEKISREMLDKTNIGGGSVEIDIYNASQFNLGQRISEIKELNEYDVCKYEITVSRTEAIKKMRLFNDNEVADALEKLHKKGKLKTAILNAAIADGQPGLACQQAQIEIYANDGEVLKINYQVL